MKNVLVKTERDVDSRKYSTALAVLLVLFVFRVVGQLLVIVDAAPFLPPWSEWQSGLLPYPVLLLFQITIVVLFAKIVSDFRSATGYFVERHAWLGRPLMSFGCIYFASMIARYGIYMTICPEARWLHGTIPIFFHFVLASFLITISRFHLDRLSVGHRI